MSLPIDVAGYIELGNVAQYLSASDIALADKTGGGSLNSAFSMILYLVRRPIEVRFANDPTDETLIDTANYLYALSARYRAQSQLVISDAACISPFVLINPSSSSISEGANVTFTVLAGGTTPLTYQWRKNGVNIGGATSSSYTINGATPANDGSYDVVVTNSCGSATSTAATLVVTSALSASWWYGDTDPYTLLSLGVDNISYLGTVTIVHNDPISIPFPIGAEDNKYQVMRCPIGESVKTTWYNTALNNGTINDAIYRAAFTIGSYRYYVSRVAMSIDSTQPVIYT